MQIFSEVAQNFLLVHETFPWVIAVLLAWVGMILASFGGVLIDRLPHQLAWLEDADVRVSILSGRSHCNSCGKTLNFIQLTPVLGWLSTSGRCPACGYRVPWFYPISEYVVGFWFAVIYLLVEDLHMAFSLMAFVWAGFVISVLDLRHYWIPAVITTPMLWLGLLASPFEPEVMQRVIGAAAAGMIIWGAVAVVAVIQRKPMLELWSGGDVAFLMMAGAWLGPEQMVVFVLVATVLFLVHERTVFLRTGGREVPFGPTLTAALLLIAASQALGLNAWESWVT